MAMALHGGDYLKAVCDKRLKERGSYGIRVARPGYDARYCAENQLLFNSGWPILQICDVVDISSGGEEYSVFLNSTTGEFYDSLPAGFNKTGDGVPDNEFYGGVAVNRRYVRKCVKVEFYRKGSELVFLQKYTYRRKSHNLGFCPMFLSAKYLGGANNDNVMVLFSVDIETDIDYPYTEGPLALIKPQKDYGIKSSSIFGKRVPGLSSNQFSKLVQAVKTEQTANLEANAETGYETNRWKIPVWSPVDPDTPPSALSGNYLEPYEFFGYSVKGTTTSTGYGYENGVGGPYYSLGKVQTWTTFTGDTAPVVPVFGETKSIYAAGVINSGDTRPTPKSTLVVLRSPMVSPEYVEVIK